MSKKSKNRWEAKLLPKGTLKVNKANPYHSKTTQQRADAIVLALRPVLLQLMSEDSQVDVPVNDHHRESKKHKC
jgi:hypothetical protein